MEQGGAVSQPVFFHHAIVSRRAVTHRQRQPASGARPASNRACAGSIQFSKCGWDGEECSPACPAVPPTSSSLQVSLEVEVEVVVAHLGELDVPEDALHTQVQRRLAHLRIPVEGVEVVLLPHHDLELLRRDLVVQPAVQTACARVVCGRAGRRACVRACVRECERACVRACMGPRMGAYACVCV